MGETCSKVKGHAITNMKTVSLVLGSGGARGHAHIGVIRWLEENVDLSWEKSGLVRGDKLINTLIKLVGEQLIEELPFAYTAVATDLKSQKEIWIQSGSLFNAMRASFAIPLLLTPFKHKGGTLVDGGVLNPVPIAPTFGDGTDITIAVNLGGPAEEPGELSTPSVAPVIASAPLHKKLTRFIDQLKSSMPSRSSGDWGAYDVAMQAFETMQSTIARQKLAAYPPDILIEIPRNVCRTLEFDRAAEMIDLGYRRAKECLAKAAG